MICSLSLSSQIWSNRSYGIAQWTKTYVECFTLLRSLFSKDVEWRQWLISWQILDWLQLRSRRMRMLGKKQETFKQLHQEKQHTKRARKSAGQNIRDLNRKAATVLWKICASTLLSNFNLQHKFVFFFIIIKKRRWNVCQSTHPNEAKSWRNSGKKRSNKI